MFRKGNEQGFTLIDILVTIIIIAILASIAIPIYRNQQEKAAIGTLKSDLRNIGTFMEEYIVAHDGKYPLELPDESFKEKSKNNVLSLSEDGTCVRGVNDKHMKIAWYYDATRKIVTDESWCGRSSLPSTPTPPKPSDSGGNPAPGGGGGELSTIVTAAVYVGTPTEFTNQWRLSGAGADLYVEGDFECNSQVTVDGDVIVTGKSYLTNSCYVGGTVWSQGDVRMNSTPTITGNVNTPGDISFQSTAKVNGSLNMGGRFTSTDGRTVVWLKENGRVGGDVNEGWSIKVPKDPAFPKVQFPKKPIVEPITWSDWLKKQANYSTGYSYPTPPLEGKGCAITTKVDWSIKGDIEIREKTILDARKETAKCNTITFGGKPTIKLFDDLTIWHNGIDFPNGANFISGDGGKHVVRILSESTTGVARCDTKEDVINLGVGTAFAEHLDVLLYTDSLMEINGGTSFKGQAIAGCMRASGLVNIGYTPITTY